MDDARARTLGPKLIRACVDGDAAAVDRLLPDWLAGAMQARG
jgi:hypothetical protein